jgi:amino acid transporter
VVGATSYLSRSIGRLAPSWQPVPVLAQVVIAVVLALGVGALLLLGVRRATVVMLVTEVMAIGAVVASLVLAAVVGAEHVPQLGTVALQAWTRDLSPSPLGTGVVVALTAFIGFESSSALGAESQRPMRTLPRVITFTAVGIGVLLTLATLVQSAAFDALGLGPSANPVDDILSALGVAGALPVLDLAVMASFLACATASMMALARLVMALAIDGVLPAALGVPHPRRRTPHRAALVVLPILVGVPAVLLAAGVPVRVAMDHLIQASMLGYLAAYLLVSVSVLRFLPRIGERTLRPIVVAALAGAGLSAALVMYLVVTLRSGLLTPVLVLVGVIALVLLWWWRISRRDPSVLTRLGAYDQPSTKSVWWGPSPSRRHHRPGPGTPP